jgi:aspartyl-tRNA(Asn)/glutamyl-tRNA(Gln) amidotransferase subunit C
MSLSPSEVEHIAALAHLELTPEEKDLYCSQLSAILDYATRLKNLDTSGIAPTSSVNPTRSVLRDDEPSPGLSPAELLQNAPRADQDQFRVPPVLD